MTVLQESVDPDLTSELDSLLSTLTFGDSVRAANASGRIVMAAETYRASFPIRDINGRLTRPSVAKGRAALAALNKQLAAARSTIEELPLDALEALANEAGGAVGPLITSLNTFAPAAHSAHATLAERPDKSIDTECACFAMEVAVVFRDILKMPPRSTRISGSNISGKRGGGAYARVLKVGLQLAGRPTANLGPIIDRGLALLVDPGLPHNLE